MAREENSREIAVRRRRLCQEERSVCERERVVHIRELQVGVRERAVQKRERDLWGREDDVRRRGESLREQERKLSYLWGEMCGDIGRVGDCGSGASHDVKEGGCLNGDVVSEGVAVTDRLESASEEMLNSDGSSVAAEVHESEKE